MIARRIGIEKVVTIDRAKRNYKRDTVRGFLDDKLMFFTVYTQTEVNAVSFLRLVIELSVEILLNGFYASKAEILTFAIEDLRNIRPSDRVVLRRSSIAKVSISALLA